MDGWVGRCWTIVQEVRKETWKVEHGFSHMVCIEIMFLGEVLLFHCVLQIRRLKYETIHPPL